MAHVSESHRPLDGIRVLMLVDDDYEDLELWYPKLRLEEAGGHVIVAGLMQGRTYSGKHGYPCASDAVLGDMEAGDFHGIVIPGGWMPDKLRRHEKVLDLVREFAPTASWWRRSATEAGFPSRRVCIAGFASPVARGSRTIS
jgi:protease I